MASKAFTAQEMREAASVCETVEVADQFYSVEMDRSAAMLRYAADVVERCDWQKSHLDGLLEGKDSELAGVTLRQVVNTEKSIVDYILRGDAGKGSCND